MNMRENITKDFSLASLAVCIGSVSKLMSIRSTRIGVLIFQTFRTTGWISALRVFWFWDMWHTLSSAIHWPPLSQGLLCLRLRLILWRTLSALSISIGIACLPFFKHSQSLILIEKFGFKATMKKRTALRVLARLNALHWGSTKLCARKVLQRQSQQCVS